MAKGKRLEYSAAKCDTVLPDGSRCPEDAELVLLMLDSFDVEVSCISCHIRAVMATAMQGAEAAEQSTEHAELATDFAHPAGV